MTSTGLAAGEVAIVGDFDPAECLPILRETFSGWTARQPYARIPKVVFPQVKGEKLEIITPDKANAVYVAGLVFPMKDDDPDYAAWPSATLCWGRLAFVPIGRSSASKEGLSYGVGSFISSDSFDPRSS